MTERCVGCGAVVAKADGPTHRYLGTSPGCWSIYGNILAKEYSDARYAAVHALTADAYPVQHPGAPSPQTIQSVAVHLISLYLQLEQGLPPEQAAATKQAAKERLANEFAWLEPPANVGDVTAIDVERAANPAEHRELVARWARSAWSAWSVHHATIRDWAAHSRRI